MKKIVEATYPSLSFADEVQEMDCEKTLTNGEYLACKWQRVVQVMSTVATIHPQMRVDFIYSVSLPSALITNIIRLIRPLETVC